MAPLPGDFAVVSLAGEVGRLISLGERLCGTGFTQYDHALIYLGNMNIVEAEPGGARCRKILDESCGYKLTEWSTGRIALTPVQREGIVSAARKYADARVPYSWADYFALAAHHLHLPIPGLRKAIADKGSMICSQLVDRCYQDAGVQLFNDKRWNGYVMPSDLAGILTPRSM